MLQGDGGSDALKAPALIVGIAFLIVTVLYVAKRCGPNLFGQETIPRNYLRGSNDPSEITSDGEKPRMWDIWIVSGCSLYSQQGSRLERQGWAEFLVSCLTSFLNQSDPSISLRFARSCLSSWISSHYLLTRCRTQIPTFPHHKRRPVIPSDPHHRPKSKSVSSSSCRPFPVLRLHLLLPHRTQPPTITMTCQENIRLGRLTSRTPQTTDFPLLGS